MPTEIFQTILAMIFWDFSMLYQTFVSPQVKRIMIISNKSGVNKFPNEFPNNSPLDGLSCPHKKKDLGS